jgi:hypothetical protein
MKKLITSSLVVIAIAAVLSSCSSKHGMAYNKHLKNSGKCLISSEGCGWAK